MLRVIQSNAKAAKGYYVSRAEYLAGGKQELPGRWGGRGAEMLDLWGDVARRAADALCDNRNPITGERLTVRQRQDRTPGYDFNWHASKTVSLLYGLTGDPAILDAFRDSVDDAMRMIEAEIQTRVRKDGRMEDRTAPCAIWSEYTHLTARPVAGVIDPHLHSHCFIYNAVFDPAEQRWKAGKFSNAKASAPRYERAFHQNLARRLSLLGYPIEWKGHAFEIAGFDRKTVEKFSGRTRQVEAYAARHGITDARAKDGLGARTRSRKRHDATMPQLLGQWQRRLTERDRAALAVATARRPFTAKTSKPLPYGGMGRNRVQPANSHGSSVAWLPPGLAERQSDPRRHRHLNDLEDYRQAVAGASNPSHTSSPRLGHGR